MKDHKTLVGIWIDHANAHIVKCDQKEIREVITVTSEVEAHHKSGVEGGEHHTIVNQAGHMHRREQQMHAYCKEILSHLRDADEIVVFGPANAKHDLKRAIEDEKWLNGKLKGIETTDEMTENQLRAYVEEMFHLPRYSN